MASRSVYMFIAVYVRVQVELLFTLFDKPRDFYLYTYTQNEGVYTVCDLRITSECWHKYKQKYKIFNDIKAEKIRNVKWLSKVQPNLTANIFIMIFAKDR